MINEGLINVVTCIRYQGVVVVSWVLRLVNGNLFIWGWGLTVESGEPTPEFWELTVESGEPTPELRVFAVFWP